MLQDRAKRAFTRMADDILSEFRTVLPDSPGETMPGSISELIPEAHLSVEEGDLIGPGMMFREDDRGRLHEVTLVVGREFRRLDRNASIKVDELADSVAFQLSSDAEADAPWVRAHLLRWLEARLNGNTEGWLDALSRDLTHESVDHVVITPLEGLHIEKPFEVGGVDFFFLQRELVEKMLDLLPAEVRHVDKIRDRERKSLAGRVCAKVSVRGPADFAQRRAGLLVDQALDFLRFMHPAAQASNWVCCFGRLGQNKARASHYYLEKDGLPTPAMNGFDTGFGSPHIVTAADVALWEGCGMRRAADLIAKLSRTQFEQCVVDSIGHFARAAEAARLEDRAVHAFLAIESLLLRNHQESIKETISRRTSIVLARSHSRPDVAEAIRRAYKVRSNFIHHGKMARPQDVKAVDLALPYCWELVLMAAAVAHLHPTRQAYIRAIEMNS